VAENRAYRLAAGAHKLYAAIVPGGVHPVWRAPRSRDAEEDSQENGHCKSFTKGEPNMWISPNHALEEFGGQLSLDNKITVFEDRTLGWQIDVADILINGRSGVPALEDVPRNPHAGFAVLSILFSYFEMIAKLEDGFVGQGQYRTYFERGFGRVFPDLMQHPPTTAKGVLDKVYTGVRCGLYHVGITAPGVQLDGEYPCAVTFSEDGNALLVNPLLLPDVLRQHLKSYVSRLRDPANADLRRKFEARFDHWEGPRKSCPRSEPRSPENDATQFNTPNSDASAAQPPPERAHSAAESPAETARRVGPSGTYRGPAEAGKSPSQRISRAHREKGADESGKSRRRQAPAVHDASGRVTGHLPDFGKDEPA
jgi:hypothetical protein